MNCLVCNECKSIARAFVQLWSELELLLSSPACDEGDDVKLAAWCTRRDCVWARKTNHQALTGHRVLFATLIDELEPIEMR